MADALTPEQLLELRRANLAKGRKTRAERAAQKAGPPEPEPVREMPRIEIDEGAGPELPVISAAAVPSPEDTPFDRFLSGLDAETRELLDEAELRAIFAAQTVKAKAERKTALQKSATEKALHQAKVEAGVLPAAAIADAAWKARMAEKVTFTPDLPSLGDIGLRVDGTVYLHGHRVTVTMGQYLSFREMEWRAKQAELDFEGRARDHHLRQGAGSLNLRLNGVRA